MSYLGSSEAEAQGGTVVQSLEHIMLEALPAAMPSVLQVDISVLEDFGQSVLVRDIELPDGVIALTDDTVAVATALAPRVAEEDEEEVDELELDEEGEEETAEDDEAAEE